MPCARQASLMKSSPALPRLRQRRPLMNCTRRTHAQRVQFITAADTSGNLPPGLNLQALADPQATTVVFMGKRTFPALASALIAQGLSPDTPAMLAESVSQPEQALWRGTITTLSARLETERGPLPGLIIFGPLAEGSP
jgi:uroporphyrin-III C-methyltransferase